MIYISFFGPHKINGWSHLILKNHTNTPEHTTDEPCRFWITLYTTFFMINQFCFEQIIIWMDFGRSTDGRKRGGKEQVKPNPPHSFIGKIIYIWELKNRRCWLVQCVPNGSTGMLAHTIFFLSSSERLKGIDLLSWKKLFAFNLNDDWAKEIECVFSCFLSKLLSL